ncbi:SHOCT domain-containing protein [Enterococcus sp. 22-H-5-01]|uniref:SHOCT domain-containing protein n=1 Tax=Enterococcus sp. 22-H-5-01 TaxID=3418555 RepID=UPI003CFE1FEF
MNTCYFCNHELKLFKTSQLNSGEKICNNCKNKTKKDLSLSAFDKFQYSLDEIYQKYFKIGVDLESSHKKQKAFLKEIDETEESFSRFLRIIGGANLINTIEYSYIHQLKDGRIYFKNNDEDFFYLKSIEFEGPKFKTVTIESSQGSSSTNTIQKEKIKGKAGKVASGAIIGSIIAPGLGTAVGAYAGSKGKDKKKITISEQANNKSHSTNTTQEVEEKSLGTLTIERIADGKVFSITIKIDSEGYHELSSGMESKNDLGLENELSYEQVVSKLKELKKLVDLGILSEEEFNQKKANYINFL